MDHFFPPSSSVQEIDYNKYYDLQSSAKPNQCYAIMFYAPWCGHCKNAKEAWIRFGEKALMDVYAVNSDTQSALLNSLREEGLNVVGFPTFIYFKAGQPVLQHTGERTVQGFLQTGMKSCRR